MYLARLPLPAVDILFDDLGLGAPPQPFEIPVVGDTTEERQRLREVIHRTMERAGAMRAGRLDPKIEDALVVLARAPFVLAATGDAGDGKLLARACSDGRDAVLARQDGNHISIRLVRPTAVVAALIDLLPDIPAGRGASLTMPMPQAQQRRPSRDDEDYDPLAGARERPTTGRPDKAIARVLAQPRLGLGALTASVRRAASSTGTGSASSPGGTSTRRTAPVPAGGSPPSAATHRSCPCTPATTGGWPSTCSNSSARTCPERGSGTWEPVAGGVGQSTTCAS